LFHGFALLRSHFKQQRIEIAVRIAGMDRQHGPRPSRPQLPVDLARLDKEKAWLLAMSWRCRHLPFNAEQTVNIVGEIGPLFAMFIVNGLYGIAAGTWALIICTVLSLVVTLCDHRRSYVGADQGDPVQRPGRPSSLDGSAIGEELFPFRVSENIPTIRRTAGTSSPATRRYSFLPLP
jgi:hypothetical protein